MFVANDERSNQRLKPEVIIADKLYDFDSNLFRIDEMPESEIDSHAKEVAESVAKKL
ncbi:Uncharacterised protein [uncultured archaeon]|nr:Uncharacterised protein [uncultured archaeon]